MADPKVNDLYIAILPLIHLGASNYGFTEQVLTLIPDRNLATSFFPDEVEGYILTLKHRTKYLVGGHVTGYVVETEPAENGRVVVRVTQDVQ